MKDDLAEKMEEFARNLDLMAERMTDNEYREKLKEINKNLELITQAIIKSNNGEFKRVEDVHRWLYEHGCTTTKENKIQFLHIAEQLDAEYDSGAGHS
jgi:phage tail tape-measure protein